MRTFLLSIIVLFTAAPAHAATIELVASREPAVNSPILITATLNTEGESINAIEGMLSYPHEAFSLREIRDGNSIVNFWIERPEESEGKVHFAGITPGGFLGSNGELFTLLFDVRSTESIGFTLSDARALKNDGQGTSVPLILPNPMRVDKSDASYSPVAESDRLPPEEFDITPGADPALFDGEDFIVFAAQDKGSSIDHYVICTYHFSRACEQGESPYVLGRGFLVSVTAYDSAGNSRAKWLYTGGAWGNSAILVLVILTLIAIALWRRKRAIRT